MGIAEEIGGYCRACYIEPAHARGDAIVTIRPAEVDSALGFKSQLTDVCWVLATAAFGTPYPVRLIDLDGPPHAANTLFTFRIEYSAEDRRDREAKRQTKAEAARREIAGYGVPELDFD